jgi:glycosyltransferase involved in cell wall biosynthesis
MRSEILFVTDDLGGGTGNHLLSMISLWDAERWRARIISGAALTARVRPGVEVTYLPPRRRTDRYPVGQIRSLARIARLLEGMDPDVVHTYFFWPILYGRLLKLAGRVRVLVENREDQGFNWGVHEYALLRGTRSLPDRVICVSEAVRRVVMEREGIDPARTAVVHNGVGVPPADPGGGAAFRREMGIAEEDLVVGMVANFNRPVKGVSHFLEAAPRILAAVPGARFLIAGRGREEEALRRMARDRGVEQRVVFAGFRSDIHRCYDAMDVSVLTSLSEGLSLTLLESMAHGLPVVATNVGGNPEAVADGETGFLVPPRDAESFSEAVTRLLMEPGLRERMGREARRRVLAGFRIEDAVSRYLGHYEDLLDRKGRRAIGAAGG